MKVRTNLYPTKSCRWHVKQIGHCYFEPISSSRPRKKVVNTFTSVQKILRSEGTTADEVLADEVLADKTTSDRDKNNPSEKYPLTHQLPKGDGYPGEMSSKVVTRPRYEYPEQRDAEESHHARHNTKSSSALLQSKPKKQMRGRRNHSSSHLQSVIDPASRLQSAESTLVPGPPTMKLEDAQKMERGPSVMNFGGNESQ